jgi:O-antigen/teichoic acid export membrane protein
MPYIVRKLTPEVYGIYILAIFLIGAMSFLDLGFGQGIIKFVSQYEAKGDYRRINQIISVSLIIYVGMGLLGCVLILSFANFLVFNLFKVSSGYTHTALLAFRLIAFGFLINFIGGIFSNIPKALQRYDVSVKIQNLISILSTILTVVLLYLGKGLIEILIGFIIFQLSGLILSYYASKELLPTLNIKVEFDKTVFNEIFGFSVFTAVNVVTGNFVVKVDKIIIGGFLGIGTVPYYSVPFMIAQAFSGFIGAITQHLFPNVSYLQALHNKEKLINLHQRAFRWAISLSVIIVIELVLLGNSFLRIWMGKEFAGKCLEVLPVIAVALFFSNITSISLWFYTGFGYTRINMFSSLVGSLCYLLGTVFLIPRFGLQGAAMSFFLMLIPFPLYHYYLLKKILRADLRWYYVIFIKVLVLIILTLILKHFFYIGANNIMELFVKSLMVVFILSILLVFCRIFDLQEVYLIVDKFSVRRRDECG